MKEYLKIVIRGLSCPFVHIYDKVTPDDHSNLPLSERFVLKRTDTLEYYRGGRMWKWCNSARNAAYLSEGYWNEFIVWKLKILDIPYRLINVGKLEID